MSSSSSVQLARASACATSRRQPLAEVGMGDRDQRLGPRAQVEPPEVGDPVLGHDEVDVRPRGGHRLRPEVATILECLPSGVAEAMAKIERPPGDSRPPRT